jgi:tetratricopeptide (TPR) repeat protein
MLARLRRAALVAVCSLPTVLPIAAVVAAPLVTAACGGGGGGKKKQTTTPKGPKVKGPTYDDYLKDARTAAEEGKVDKAHAAYRKAESMKQDVAIIEEHTRFLVARRQPDAAVEVAKGYYEAKPADARGQLIYGEALLAAGKPADAADIGSAVLAIEEGNAAGYELRGRALVMSGKVDAGLEDLRKAVELAPDDANFLTSLGQGLRAAKQTDEAALRLRAAVEKDPKNPRALRLLGALSREQFEVQDSVKWLLEATKADPGDAEAWFELALSQFELGDQLEAENSAERATQLAPDNTKFWYVYGETLRNNKKPEQATAAYYKSLAIKPSHPKAAAKIAVTLYDSQKYGEAEVFITDALKTDPRNPYLYYNLGWVYSAQKKYKLAIDSFEKYLSLAPKDDGDIGKAKAEIKSLKRKRP